MSKLKKYLNENSKINYKRLIEKSDCIYVHIITDVYDIMMFNKEVIIMGVSDIDDTFEIIKVTDEEQEKLIELAKDD